MLKLRSKRNNYKFLILLSAISKLWCVFFACSRNAIEFITIRVSYFQNKIMLLFCRSLSIKYLKFFIICICSRNEQLAFKLGRNAMHHMRKVNAQNTQCSYGCVLKLYWGNTIVLNRLWKVTAQCIRSVVEKLQLPFHFAHRSNLIIWTGSLRIKPLWI